MGTKIVINTDDLRKATQYLRGALDELADIRDELARVSSTVDDNPDFAVWRQQILTRLNNYGGVIAHDVNTLMRDITTLEELEGKGPAGFDQKKPASGLSVMRPGLIRVTDIRAALLALSSFRIPSALRTSQGGDPPEWDEWAEDWVDDAGKVLEEGISWETSGEVGFEQKWEARDESGDEKVGASGRTWGEHSGGAHAEGGASASKDGVEAHGKAGAHYEGEVGFEGEAHAGPFGASGGGSAKVEAHAEAEGEVSATKDGVTAKGKVSTGVSTEAEVHGEVHAGSAGASGGASAKAEAHAEAEGEVSATKDGVKMEGKASAGASAEVEAHGEVHAGGTSVGGEAHAKAQAEASAEGVASIGKDGVKAGWEASANASAEVGTGASVSAGGVDADIKGGVTAGVGVQAGGSVSADGEGIKVKVKLGATLGLGFNVDLNFTIGWDVLNPVKQLENAVNMVIDTVESIVNLPDTLYDMGCKITDAIGDAVQAIEDFFDPPSDQADPWAEAEQAKPEERPFEPGSAFAGASGDIRVAEERPFEPGSAFAGASGDIRVAEERPFEPGSAFAGASGEVRAGHTIEDSLGSMFHEGWQGLEEAIREGTGRQAEPIKPPNVSAPIAPSGGTPNVAATASGFAWPSADVAPFVDVAANVSMGAVSATADVVGRVAGAGGVPDMFGELSDLASRLKGMNPSKWFS